MKKIVIRKIRRDKKRLVSFLMCIILVGTSVSIDGIGKNIDAKDKSYNQELSQKDKKAINDKKEKLIDGYNKVKESKKENKKSKVVKEIKDLRTANTNTYLMSDGSRRLEMFSDDIRFKEDGKYKDYNPLLKKLSKEDKEKLSKKVSLFNKNNIDDFELVNSEGDSKQFFPKKLDKDNSVVLLKKKYGISFSPTNIEKINEDSSEEDGNNSSDDKEETSDVSEKESELKENESKNIKDTESSEVSSANTKDLILDNSTTISSKVSYCSSDKKIKYNYNSLTNGVKEEIVLYEKPDTNIFEFDLNLSNLKVFTSKFFNEVRLLDEKTDKLVAYINEPFITDDNKVINYESIKYEIDKDSNKLKIKVDESYLESKDTKYPIKIDPTAIWTSDRLESATVLSVTGANNTNLKNTNQFRVHNNGVSIYPGAEEICYIDTSGLDNENYIFGNGGEYIGSDVHSARLIIKEKSSAYFTGTSVKYITPGNIEVKRPTSSWDVNTITWNNQPNLSSEVVADFDVTGVAGTSHVIDLTNWAQSIADTSIENTGLALKSSEVGKGGAFYSASLNNTDYMQLTIDYSQPKKGDNTWYTYENFETPNGSGKVELTEGNLVYNQKDFDLPSQQLGLDVSRTYNSRNVEKGCFGVGWNLKYEEKIRSSGPKSMEYTDETGALISFAIIRGSWTCYENPDLSIGFQNENITKTISENNTVSFETKYQVINKDKTVKHFDEDGKLRLIEDANGNFVYIKYHSSYGTIEKIYSSAGQELELEYSTSGQDHFVSRIELADESSFNYSYTDKRLTSVTHTGTNNNEITYEYEYNLSGRLNKIIDAKGDFYTIGYDGKIADEIKSPNNDETEIITNYEPNKTRVYKKNGDNEILSYETYEFDNDGKVIKSTNDLGNETLYTYQNYLVEKTVDKVKYYKLENGVVNLITPTGEGDDKHLEEENTYDEDNNYNIIREVDEEGNETEYTYGDSQNPDLPTKTKVTDAEGTVTANENSTYDSNGNLSREVDKITNTVTSYKTDNKGNVTSEENVLVDHDNINNITNGVLNSGLEKSSSTSTYDKQGNDLTNNTSEGTVTSIEKNQYSTDKLGRVLQSTDEKKDIVINYTYDEFGRTITTTTTIPDKSPEVTHSSYDDNGKIIEEIDKCGRYTNYTYDNMGRVTSKTLSYGNESKTTTTSYGYEYGISILIRTESGSGLNKYYPVVSVVTERNENNEVVSKKYSDPYGQLVREETNGVVSDYSYDKQGNVFSTYTRGESNTNPSSPKLTLTLYDKNGKLTDTIQNPEYSNSSFRVSSSSIVTTNTYDDAGNLIQEKDAKGNITSYEYNAEGKITKVSVPDGSSSGNDTIYAYDIHNYDETGNNIDSTKDTTTNALGNVSETVYNGGGQVLSVTDKGTNTDITTTFDYDTSGNKTKETFSNGKHISYSYNEKDQMTSASYVNANDEITRYSTYEYNSDDLLYKVVDYKKHNNTLYPYKYTYSEYDDFGKVVGFAEINASNTPSQSTINAHMLTYSYDIEDKLTEIRYPKTANDKLKGIKLYYNGYKWLTSIKGIISENNEEVERNVRTYDYYNDSKIKNIKDYRDFMSSGNSYINKEYQYDSFDRVTSMEYRDSSDLNTILEKHTYSYDKNSNILSEGIINNYPQNQSDRINETRIYTYDDLNRLKTSKVINNNNQTEKNNTYTYDKVGNITRITEGNIVTENTYNKFNQLTSSVIKNNNSLVETKIFTYDASGNLTKEKTLDNTNTITEIIKKEYDNDNHMTKWLRYEGGTNESLKSKQINTYSNDGKRMIRVDDEDVNDSEDVKTKFFYQGDNLLYTTDGSGNKKSQNIVGPDNNIIATVQYDDGQHAYFYNKDIRTSVTNIVDESGNGVVRYKYDDFGETTKLGNTDFYNEICYTSGVYDELTKEYYLNARFYDPEDRVFTTQDSYRGEQKDYHTWNMYAYCGGNPINSIDPSGHMAEVVLYGYGAANCWNPSGWIALAAATAITIGTAVTVYYAGKKIKGVVSAKSKNGKKIKVKKVKAKKSPKKNNRQGNNKNNSNKPTNKVYKVKDKGRIDVEYQSANNKLTGIHYHAPNGIKYLLYRSGEWIARNGDKPTKSIRKIMKSDYFQKALRKARDFLYK